ncbi:hypothetical protein E2562_004891 [Oryza meyeriana var. granulata]|uniref:Uncharacterized protein n=1 Tax=Oryza meyeriana var. granulata TaxID=110450 RepID=A0A6G1C4J5_9ORYZ|nr:hypothetical protein E2562_004891 [Oryza meyeriana var. granulata]
MCLRRRSVTYFTHDAKHRLVEADAPVEDGDGEFTCDCCLVAGAGLRYLCTHPGCAFKLHEACARRFPRSLKSVVHLEHRLKRDDIAFAGAGGKCEVCGDDVKGACYGCAKCGGGGIVVHPLCVHLPPVARGAAHGDGAHDAWLVRASDGGVADCAAAAATACGRGVGAWRYRCVTCRVDMHPRCLVPAADQCLGGGGGDAPATASSKGKSCCLALVDDVTNCVAVTGYGFFYRFHA